MGKRRNLFLFLLTVIVFIVPLYAALTPEYVVREGRGKRIYIALDPLFFTKLIKGTMQGWSWSYSIGPNSNSWDNCIYPTSSNSCWAGSPIVNSGSLFGAIHDYLDGLRFTRGSYDYEKAWCDSTTGNNKYTYTIRGVRQGCPSNATCICGGDANVKGTVDSNGKLLSLGKFLRNASYLKVESRSYRGDSALSSSSFGELFFHYQKGFPWLRHITSRILLLPSPGKQIYVAWASVDGVGANVETDKLPVYLEFYFNMLNDFFRDGNSFSFKHDLLSYFQRIPVICNYFGADDDAHTTWTSQHTINSFLVKNVGGSKPFAEKSKYILSVIANARVSNGHSDNVTGYLDLIDNANSMVPGNPSYNTVWWGVSARKWYTQNGVHKSSYSPDTWVCPNYALEEIRAASGVRRRRFILGGTASNDVLCAVPASTEPGADMRRFTNVKFCRYKFEHDGGWPIDHQYIYTYKMCYDKTDCAFGYIPVIGYKWRKKVFARIIKDSLTGDLKEANGYYDKPLGKYLKPSIGFNLHRLFYVPQTFLGLRVWTGSSNNQKYGTFFQYPGGMALHDKVYLPGYTNIVVGDVGTGLASFYVFHSIVDPYRAEYDGSLHSTMKGNRSGFAVKMHTGAYAKNGYIVHPTYDEMFKPQLTPPPFSIGSKHYYGSLHANNWIETLKGYYRNGSYDGWNEGTSRYFFGKNGLSVDPTYNFLIPDAVPLLNPYSILNIHLGVKTELKAVAKVVGINVAKFNLNSVVNGVFPTFEMPIDVLALITGDPQPTDGVDPDDVYNTKKNAPCMQDKDGDGYLDCYLPDDINEARKVKYGTIEVSNSELNKNIIFDVGLFPVASDSDYNSNYAPIWFDFRFFAEPRETLSCLDELSPEPTDNEKDFYAYENINNNSAFEARMFPRETDHEKYASDIQVVISKYMVRHLVYLMLQSGLLCKRINISTPDNDISDTLLRIFPYLENVNGGEISEFYMIMKPIETPEIKFYRKGHGPFLPYYGSVANDEYTEIYITIPSRVDLYADSVRVVSFRVLNHFVLAIKESNTNSIGISLYYDPQITDLLYKPGLVEGGGQLGDIIPSILSGALNATLDVNFNPFAIYNDSLDFTFIAVPFNVRKSDPYSCLECPLLRLGLSFTGKVSLDDIFNISGMLRDFSITGSPAVFDPTRTKLADFKVGVPEFNLDRSLLAYVDNLKKYYKDNVVDFEVSHNGKAFIYSVDGGFWSPPVTGTSIRTRFLLDGEHTLKLRVLEGDDYGEVEEFHFVVDSIPPVVKLHRRGDYLDIYVEDANAVKKEIFIDGKMVENVPDSIPVTDMYGVGDHVIKIRVTDAAGNVTSRTYLWKDRSESSGCSMGGNDYTLLGLILVAFFFLLGRRGAGFLRKVIPGLFILLLLSGRLFAGTTLQYRYNPEKDASKNAIGIKLTTYFYSYISNRLETILESNEFKNYVDMQLKLATNNIENPKVVINRYTFQFDLPYIDPRFSFYGLNQFMGWDPKPIMEVNNLTYGIGRSVSFVLYLLNTTTKGGSFYGFTVDSNSVNPLNRVIDYGDVSIVLQPDPANTTLDPGTGDFIKFSVLFKDVTLYFLADVPPAWGSSGWDRNGNGVDDFRENASYLNTAMKMSIVAHFDLSLSGKAKIYAARDFWDILSDGTPGDLGKLKIYFEYIDFNLSNFTIDNSDLSVGPLEIDYKRTDPFPSGWNESYPVNQGFFKCDSNSYWINKQIDRVSPRWTLYTTTKKVYGSRPPTRIAGMVQYRFRARCCSAESCSGFTSQQSCTSHGGCSWKCTKTFNACGGLNQQDCSSCGCQWDRIRKRCIGNVTTCGTNCACPRCQMKCSGSYCNPYRKCRVKAFGFGDTLGAEFEKSTWYGTYYFSVYGYNLKHVGDSITTYPSCKAASLSTSFGHPIIVIPPNDSPSTINCYYTPGLCFDRRELPSEDIKKILNSITGDIRATIEKSISYTVMKYVGGTVVFDLSDDDIRNKLTASTSSGKVKITPVIDSSLNDSRDYYRTFYSHATGNLMPVDMAFAMDLIEGTSCILNNKEYGWIDGWKSKAENDDPDDDPYMVNSNVNVGFAYSKASGYYSDRAVLGGNYITIVNGPAFQDTGYVVGHEKYQIGIAIHQNLLNNILYDSIAAGFLCFDISGKNPNGDISFLTTEGWKELIPFLYKNYPGKALKIKFIPALKDLNGNYDVPKVFIGGERFSTQNYSAFPDLTVEIPNGYLEFYVEDGSDWKKLFTIVADVKVGLDFDIYRDLKNDWGYNIQNSSFPVGCGSAGFPCEISNVRTKVVVGLGIGISSRLKDISSDVGTGNTEELNHAISNIISMMLQSNYNLFAEAVFDPAVFIGAPITLNLDGTYAAFVGSSWRKETKSDQPLDADGNGFGDYLVIAFGIDDKFGDSIGKYFVRFLLSHGKIDQIYDSNFRPVGFTDPAPPAVPPDGEEVFRNIDEEGCDCISADAGIKVERGGEALIEIQPVSLSDSIKEDRLGIKYSVDGGVWSPLTMSRHFRIRGLTVGEHELRVVVVDSENGTKSRILTYRFDVPESKEIPDEGVSYSYDNGVGCSSFPPLSGVVVFLLILPLWILLRFLWKREV